ncbi:MAG TPA: M14 family zinc carboxypeptidase, partial [Bacteroidales bacterium]|nr:M14 family zinc carboxypeptidase [Bacteroidales bacterium]
EGAVVIKFNITDKVQLKNDLTNIMSIDNVRSLPNNQGYEVRAYLKQNELQEFLTRNIPFEIVEIVQPKAITMATTVAQMANWDRYPTYSVYEQMMVNFATTYPTLCDLDTILASTPNGHRILVLKISDNVNTNENEPQVLFSSSIHGNEETGYVLVLRLINYLLSNYTTLPQVANLVNGAEIWICPSANPDGTYRSGDNTISTSTFARYNANGVDMNRNYPCPDSTLNSDSTIWEPETKAFIKFAKKHHFNMGVNFHDGYEVVNFPWDRWLTTENISADDAWWRRASRMYADSVHLNAGALGSSYFTAEDNGITEGADWYYAYGSRQDYMNFFQYCREVTIELSTSQPAGAENLPTFWNAHYRSFLNYIKESLYGVRGVVTDSCSGQPIRAKVWVNGYDQTNDSSHVYSALPVGNYHKYMINGTRSITYSAPGYVSKTINNVVLANGQATTVNVSLAPAASPDAQFIGTITNNCTGTVQFTNTSTASSNFIWFFGDGT